MQKFFLGFTFIFSCQANEGLNVMGKITEPNFIEGSVIKDGLFVGKDTFGMRMNATAVAIQANPQKKYSVPVLGINYTMQLANYKGRDSVGLYVDNSSGPFKNDEIIYNVTFTPTSFSSKEIIHLLIKPGMIISSSDFEWAGIVYSVQSETVRTYGWVNTKTKKMGTPPNGVTIIINPVTKIWAANFNAFLLDNSKATAMVIQENGIVNNSIINPSAVNGIDNIVLPSSKFGATAAFLARPALSGYLQQWAYGFVAQGAKNANFLSSNSPIHKPDIGFYENSQARTGLVFSGDNINNSVEWRNKGVILSAIDSNGLIKKMGYVTKKISKSETLNDSVGRYIVDCNDSIELTLPRKEKIYDGYTLKFFLTNSNCTVYFKSLDSDVAVNNITDVSGGDVFYFSGRWYVEV